MGFFFLLYAVFAATSEYLFSCMHIHASVHLQCTHSVTHVCVHTHALMHVPARTHTDTDTHRLTHRYIHMYTQHKHTHTHSEESRNIGRGRGRGAGVCTTAGLWEGFLNQELTVVMVVEVVDQNCTGWCWFGVLGFLAADYIFLKYEDYWKGQNLLWFFVLLNSALLCKLMLTCSVLVRIFSEKYGTKSCSTITNFCCVFFGVLNF